MHNTLTRLQSSFGYFTTLAFTLASFIALLSVFPFPAPSSQPSAIVSLTNVQVVKGRPHYYSTKREEYAQIRFDLDADLSGLFTWNTKQIFVYVVTRYPNAGASAENMNEAVIWDMIIPAPESAYTYKNLVARFFPEDPKSRKSSKSKRKASSSAAKAGKEISKPGVIHVKNQKPKYQITDLSGVLSERTNATLQVRWNVQPWVGALTWDVGLLGQRTGAWVGIGNMQGVSESFDFPPLKGSRTDVIKDKEGPRTPRAGEAEPVVSI